MTHIYIQMIAWYVNWKLTKNHNFSVWLIKCDCFLNLSTSQCLNVNPGIYCVSVDTINPRMLLLTVHKSVLFIQEKKKKRKKRKRNCLCVMEPVIIQWLILACYNRFAWKKNHSIILTFVLTFLSLQMNPRFLNIFVESALFHLLNPFLPFGRATHSKTSRDEGQSRGRTELKKIYWCYFKQMMSANDFNHDLVQKQYLNPQAIVLAASSKAQNTCWTLASWCHRDSFCVHTVTNMSSSEALKSSLLTPTGWMSKRCGEKRVLHSAICNTTHIAVVTQRWVIMTEIKT